MQSLLRCMGTVDKRSITRSTSHRSIVGARKVSRSINSFMPSGSVPGTASVVAASNNTSTSFSEDVVFHRAAQSRNTSCTVAGCCKW